MKFKNLVLVLLLIASFQAPIFSAAIPPVEETPEDATNKLTELVSEPASKKVKTTSAPKPASPLVEQTSQPAKSFLASVWDYTGKPVVDATLSFLGKRKRHDDHSFEPAAKRKKTIFSGRPWQKVNLRDFTELCFTNLKEYPQKRKPYEQQTAPVISDYQFNEVISDFIELHKNPESELEYTKMVKWLDGQAPSQEHISHYNYFAEPKTYHYPRAEKLITKKGSRVVFMGDIHGSIHSLLRSLWRMVAKGFLNKDLTIVNPDNHMIFLGDYIDRGRYGIEVLYLLMILKLKNPQNVHLLRGNHEDPNMGGEHTIRDEIRKRGKWGCVESQILPKLYCFYDFLPFVIYLGCNGQFVQCCHGGIEPSYNPTRLLTCKNPKIIYECLYNKNEKETQQPFLKDLTQFQAHEYFRNSEHMPVGNSQQIWAYNSTVFFCPGFIWNDFCRYYNTKGVDVYNPDEMVFTGHLCVASFDVTRKYLAWLNAQLAPFGVRLNGFIRGHQHTDFGVMIFDESFNEKYKQHKASGKPGNLAENHYSDWTSVATIDEISEGYGFAMSKCFPVFTFLSAPEGVGNDKAHGIQVKFNRDSFGIVTVDSDWNNWRLAPCDYKLPAREESGSYCSISIGDGQDPICTSFSSNHPTSVINFEDLYPESSELVNHEVEQKFKELKRKMGTPQPIQQAPRLTYPIGSELKTPTLNHIRIFKNLGTANIDDSVFSAMLDEFGKIPRYDKYGKFIGYYTIPKSEYPHYIENVIKPIIEREAQFKDSHRVFYHSHPISQKSNFNILLYQEVLKRLFAWGILQKNIPVPLRFETDAHIPATLENFLDQTQSWKRDASHNFSCKFCNNETSNWFDCMRCTASLILSTNLSLFGYLDKVQLGDSTFYYFTQKDCAVEPTFLEAKLTQLLKTLKINSKFLDKIYSIGQKYSSENAAACMLQIFVKKEFVDQVAYFANPGGKPVDKPVLQDIWSADKERHTCISPFLDLYQNQPEEFDKVMQTFQYDGVNHHYNCNLNRCEARLYAVSPILYDTEKTLTFRYYTPGYLAQDKIDQFNAELDEVFDAIIKDMIKQQIQEPVQQKSLQDTQFEKLERKTRTITEETRKKRVKQKLDRLSIDMPSAKRPKLETPKDQLESLLKKAIKQKDIDSKLSTKIQGFLRDYKNTIRLRSGQTILEFALDKNSHQLIELCLHTPGYTPQITKKVFTYLYTQFQSPYTFEIIKLALDSDNEDSMVEACHLIEIEAHCPDIFAIVKTMLSKNNMICDKYAIMVLSKLVYKNKLEKEALEIIKSSRYVLTEYSEKYAHELDKNQAFRSIVKTILSILAVLSKKPEFVLDCLNIACGIILCTAPGGDLFASDCDQIISNISGYKPELLINKAIEIKKKTVLKRNEFNLLYILCQYIINNWSDLETSKFIMDTVDNTMLPVNILHAHLLTESIISKANSTEISKFTWAGQVAEKIVQIGDADAYGHACMIAIQIIEKSPEDSFLSMAMKFADKAIAANHKTIGLYLVRTIIIKTSDVEILKWVMNHINKAETYTSTKELIQLIVNKTTDSSILENAIKIVEDIIAASKDTHISSDSEYLQQQATDLISTIINKNPNPAILNWAMETANKSLSKYDLVPRIVSITSDPQILCAALEFAFKIRQEKINASDNLIKQIIKKLPDPEKLNCVKGFMVPERIHKACNLIEIIIKETTNQEFIIWAIEVISQIITTHSLRKELSLYIITVLIKITMNQASDPETIDFIYTKIKFCFDNLLENGEMFFASQIAEELINWEKSETFALDWAKKLKADSIHPLTNIFWAGAMAATFKDSPEILAWCKDLINEYCHNDQAHFAMILVKVLTQEMNRSEIIIPILNVIKIFTDNLEKNIQKLIETFPKEAGDIFGVIETIVEVISGMFKKEIDPETQKKMLELTADIAHNFDTAGNNGAATKLRKLME